MKLSYQRFRLAFRSPAATVQYPAVYRQPPHGTRVAIRNNFGECTGCLECERRCPVSCIKITAEDFLETDKRPTTSKGVLFDKKVISFRVDYAQCVNCGICVDVCGPEALSFEKNFVVPRQKIPLLNPDLVHRPRSVRIEQGFEE